MSVSPVPVPSAPDRAGPIPIAARPALWLLAATVIASVVFHFWPELDLRASAALRGPDGHFVLDGNRLVYALNDAITRASVAIFLLLVLALGAANILRSRRTTPDVRDAIGVGTLHPSVDADRGVGPTPARASPPTRGPGARLIAFLGDRRRELVYLMLTLALGPGLLVNSVLKEHSGRARPVQTVDFGGTQQFSAAWVWADQCRTNCAFVSGHAAVSTWPVAVGFAARTRATAARMLAPVSAAPM